MKCNKAAICLLVILLILVFPAAANAGCYGYSYGYSYPSYYYPPQVVVKEKYFVEYVPAFFTGWAPGLAAAYVASQGQPPQPSQLTCEQKYEALAKELKALKEELTAPKVLPQQAPQVPAGKGVLLGACVACHDRTTAPAKGKGLVLSDGGKLLPLDPLMTGKVLKEVSSGRMPKGAKLTNDQFNELMSELVELSSK